MHKTTRYEVKVLFGDCDPAGIVFFPNYSKWMDASSLHFFGECGLPPWRELQRTRGIMGAALLELHNHFHRPATYGETLHIETQIVEWRAKVFMHQHRIFRGDTLLVEGKETRAFITAHPDDPNRIRAIPIPEDIRALCS